MPVRVKMAVSCLAFVLASCASSAAVPAGDSPAEVDSVNNASAGKTVRTELEYLTSRQNADPRKLSKDEGADGANTAGQSAVSARARVSVPHAARHSSKPASYVAVAPAPVVKGRDVSSALSRERADRSNSRSRKKAHKGSKWSLAFLFSGLRNAILSSRVQYLPLLGSAPVRFKETGEFDRAKLVGFREFDERMEEVAFKNKPDVKAASDDEVESKSVSEGNGDGAKSASELKSGSVVADAGGSKPSLASVAVDAAVAAQAAVLKSAGTAPDVSVTSVRGDSRVEASGSASSPQVDYVPVSSEMVMKYFDKGGPGTEVKVGIPFVMPYQNEQPLIMDSNAKYSQTDGGTQSGTSAK